MNPILGNLLALALVSVTAALPGQKSGRPPCSLLLPAFLRPLEASDACLITGFSPHDAEAIALSPGGRSKAFLRRVTLSLYRYPSGAEPVLAPDGRVYLLHGAQPPIAALDFRGDNALETLRRKDGEDWGGGVLDVLRGEKGWVNVEFAGRPGAVRAMFLIEGEATSRVEHMIASRVLQSMQGQGPEEGATTLEGLEKDRTFVTETKKWLKEEVDLHIKVWTGEEWREAALVPPWTGLRSTAFPIDLGGTPREFVKVRLELPVSLWRIDRVALDFSSEGPIAPVQSVRLRGAGTLVVDAPLERTFSFPGPLLPSTSGASGWAGRISAGGYYHLEVPQWLP